MQKRFRPLTGHGFHLRSSIFMHLILCFRPLTGHGFHRLIDKKAKYQYAFPSPYGAWVSSGDRPQNVALADVSVPLRGMGFIDSERIRFAQINAFPSPYGAWVSSHQLTHSPKKSHRFRPLTGHGFHRQKCICLLQHQNALLNKVPHVVLSYCSNRRIYLLRL